MADHLDTYTVTTAGHTCTIRTTSSQSAAQTAAASEMGLTNAEIQAYFYRHEGESTECFQAYARNAHGAMVLRHGILQVTRL